MLKNYFLLTKNKNKNILCLKYSLQREHTPISKPDFLCIKMPLHLSILLQLIELITAINCSITSYTRLTSQRFQYK